MTYATDQREDILRAADIFVAKMAARANRVGLSAIGATKDSILGMPDEELRIAQAMAHVAGSLLMTWVGLKAVQWLQAAFDAEGA